MDMSPEIIFLTLLGVLTHWLKQVIMMKSSLTASFGTINLRKYWLTYWPETLMALTCAIAGMYALHEMNYLNPATGFSVGYMGNSAADLLGGRVQAMISAGKTAAGGK